MHYNDLTTVTEDQIVDVGVDLIHGGILIISLPTGKYLYHGDFEGSVWSDQTIHRRAKIYKRLASNLTSVSTVQFVDDLHHQNIVDLLYSEVTKKIYVLFMGHSCISVVDPVTLVAEDFIEFEELTGPTKNQQMGKLAMSDSNLYHICQTYPNSTVIRYDLLTGEKKASRTLTVPAAHGGIFFNNYLYVTTSQNDDKGSMLYKLHPLTLRIVSCVRLTRCMVATHEMVGMINPYTSVPYLFIGDENEDQSLTTVANVTKVNANNLWDNSLLTTNTAVQGGIWGVKAQNDLLWVSRGSNPGTIEMVNPWTNESTFFTFSSTVKGINGSPEIIGDNIYLKSFRRFHVPSETSLVIRATIS